MQSTHLGQADLAALSSSAAPEARVEVARKVGRFLSGAKAADPQIGTAGEIMRCLAKDSSIRVRQTLAETIAAASLVPSDVAMGLARDHEIVALPMLSRSPVYEDDDLIVIVGEGSPVKQVAVAGRPKVSDKVCVAIASCANEAAIATLVGNNGAMIGEATFTRILDAYGERDAVQRPMAGRESLPENVAGRLMRMASKELQDVILRRHTLPPDVVAAVRAGKVKDKDKGKGAGGDFALGDADPHGETAAGAHGSTPLLVLRAACEGDIGFVTEAFARLGQLEPIIVNTLLLDRGYLGLRSLFIAAGFDNRYFAAFRMALEGYQETGAIPPERRERHAKNILARFLTRHELLPAGELDEFVRLMGRIGDAAARSNVASLELH